MGKLLGLHEKVFIGETRSIAYTGTSSTAKQLLSQSSASGPARFLCRATTDAFFRQGASGMSAADSSDMLLKANETFVVIVSAETNEYFRVIQSSSGGTLYVTRLDDDTCIVTHPSFA